MERKNHNKKRVALAVIFGLALVFGLSAFMPAPALAQLESNALSEISGEATGLATVDLAIFIARIIRAVLMFMGIVLTVLIVYAGYLYMTSQGEKEKVAKAKKIISSAIIGLAIMLASYSITTYILNRLLEAAGLGGVSTTTAGQVSEPLSGSLGAGIIESHYPARNAVDVPRNTRIYVTFKEPVHLSDFILEADGSEYDGDETTTNYLNNANVLIYETDAVDEDAGITEEDVALGSADVFIYFTEGQETIVFDPVDLLGNAEEDTNYTVFLSPDILLADGTDAFTGSESDGYQWTFEVSTEVDLTPPTVVSVVPEPSTDDYDRNISVSLIFSEAMDPVAGTGTYDPDNGDTFANAEVLADGSNVEGAFSISNAYRTIEFLSNDECSEDPCGDPIYCLPGDATIDVQAHAATLSDDPPQADIVGGLFDGLTDAAGNSLDGDADGDAEGPGSSDAGGDDYEWEFTTSNTINDDAPELWTLSPDLSEENVSLDADVELTFNMLMQSSTLSSVNIQLVPDHDQTLWYSPTNETLGTDVCPADDEGNAQSCTNVILDHAALWESDETAGVYYLYYPVITQGVKSAYQICMRPSYGPSVSDGTPLCASSSNPFCCNGIPSDSACTTVSGTTLGD
jgi:hypothetical protein